jgi:hypothetical protein
VSYRDDLDAAVARADAVDRENQRLADDNQRLAAELAEAQALLGRGEAWLGGRRVKLMIAAIAIGGLGLAVAAGVYGRWTATCTVVMVAPPPSSPFVIGAMVADGPKLGHWTLNATRCVPRTDGIELTAAGDQESHIIWLTNNVVELEIPDRDFVLTKVDCYRKLDLAVTHHDTDPPTYDGHVELDCSFAGNTVQGRIEFQHCR